MDALLNIIFQVRMKRLLNERLVCRSSLVFPTSAVLGTDGVAVETWGTPLTVGAGGVPPAVLAVARHVVALVEDQVRVRVTITVTPLTGITNGHRVAIVTWSTPGWEEYVCLLL